MAWFVRLTLALMVVVVTSTLAVSQASAANAEPAGAKTSPTSSKPSTVFGMSANGEAALRAAEKTIGVKAGIEGVFADWTSSFPTAAATAAAARGAPLLISWEPWDSSLGTADQPAYSLRRILAGDFDPYIRKFARAAAASKWPVYVRWAPEMNGDWQAWSAGVNGNFKGEYADAYRHVVTTFRAAGANNVKWMFNPIVSYSGSEPLAQLYPGSDYVDWVALDGYNWGDLKWGWQSWDDIFAMGLREIAAVAPNKPLAIAEIGSAPGQGKAAWISDSLARARAAGVGMVVWFEHRKETDWRLSESAATAAAARAAVTAPGWVTGGSVTEIVKALTDAEQPGRTPPAPVSAPASRKSKQRITAVVAKKAKPGVTVALPRTTDARTPIAWATTTKKQCTVRKGSALAAKKPGVCRLISRARGTHKLLPLVLKWTVRVSRPAK